MRRRHLRPLSAHPRQDPAAPAVDARYPHPPRRMDLHRPGPRRRGPPAPRPYPHRPHPAPRLHPPLLRRHTPPAHPPGLRDPVSGLHQTRARPLPPPRPADGAYPRLHALPPHPPDPQPRPRRSPPHRAPRRRCPRARRPHRIRPTPSAALPAATVPPQAVPCPPRPPCRSVGRLNGGNGGNGRRRQVARGGSKNSVTYRTSGPSHIRGACASSISGAHVRLSCTCERTAA